MVLVCNAMITNEIYFVLFEVLCGMLVLFIAGTRTFIKGFVQCFNLKPLFDVRSCMLMRENFKISLFSGKISKSMHQLMFWK